MASCSSEIINASDGYYIFYCINKYNEVTLSGITGVIISLIVASFISNKYNLLSGITKGKNEIRINKIMALGYLGKCYLYAGSPLSINGAQVGGAHTYDYDSELCKQAAEAFGQILTMVENNGCQYSLVSFENTDIYNHKNGENIMEYSQLFYTMKMELHLE